MSTNTVPLVKDSDGIPPGLDLELNGKVGFITFSGHFYAQPDVKEQTFKRPVQIFFASKEVYVALDLEHHNIYVVDREKMLSLGCRMKAEFQDMTT